MSTLEGFCLSPQQRRQYEKNQVVVKIDIQGEPDSNRLKAALVQLSNHHEILRTRFETTPGTQEALQIIDSEPVAFFDVDESIAVDSGKHWAALKRVDGGYQLHMGLHAACLDEASLEVILQDLAKCYLGEELDEVLQYADLAEWLDDLQSEADPKIGEALQKRATLGENIGLPFSRHLAPAGPDFVFGEIELTGEYDNQAEWFGAAWCLFLWRFIKTRPLVVYASFPNRGYEGMDTVVGPFQNPLPLVIEPDVNLRFHDLLMDWEAEGRRQMEAQEMVVEGHARFAFSHLKPLSIRAAEIGLQLNSYPNLFPLSFDLHLAVVGKRITLQYNKARFSHGEALSLARSLEVLFEELAKDDRQNLAEYPMVRPASQERSHSESAMWSRTVGQTMVNKAEAPLLFDVSGSLDGKSLNASVQQLTGALKNHGVGRGDFVPILTSRTRHAVIAMLAIHQTGAAWLPLQDKVPAQRLAYILEETQARLIVGEPDLAPDGLECPVLDPRYLRDLQAEPEPYNPQGTLDDIAYVIYTSGSTGKPKGVMISNRALSEYLAAVIKQLDLPRDGHYAHLSTLAADLGHTVLFPPLMMDGALHLIGSEVFADPEKLGAYFAKNPIDVLKIVPGQMAALMEGECPELLIPQKRIIFGGERLDAELIDRIKRDKPECRVFNHYGPSEATVGVLAAKMIAGADVEPPLGMPLGKAMVEIHEPNGLLAPAGMAGEIAIGGPTLAKAYLKRPDLTDVHFKGKGDARRYLTGDIGFQLADDDGRPGNFMFIGRRDNQVKIRGFRVEIGEVEHYLRALPGVREVVVRVAGEDDRRHLRAWAVLEHGFSGSTIQAEMAEFLPEPMIPDQIMSIPEIPRTPNGKIDVARLPQPDDTQAGAVAFANEHERALAALWRDFFSVSYIGPESDFFALGGTSLTATILLSRIRKTFRAELSIEEMFQGPTVRGIAGLLRRSSTSALTLQEIKPIPRVNPLPLSYAQQRLWVLDRLLDGSTAYNLPAMLEIKGAFDFERFKKAFATVIKRHEILRSRFFVHDGAPVQEAVDQVEVDIEWVDLVDHPNPEQRIEVMRKQMMAPFNLQEPVLPRCAVARKSADEYLLMMNMHHITTDAWSREILISELDAAYQGARDLPELPVQYADFAYVDRHTDYTEDLAWWKNKLDRLPSLDLPVDYPRQDSGNPKAGQVPIAFTSESAARILALGDSLGLTPFMTLMLGFQIVLARYSGQTDFAVGFPFANRNAPELEGLIGFFVNTLVLRADLGSEDGAPLSLQEAANRLRVQTLQAMDHGQAPFEALVKEMAGDRGVGRPPLFQVLMLYRDTPGGELRLGDHELTMIPCLNPHAKFELTLEIDFSQDQFSGRIEYNADLFSETTIHKLAERYLFLLENMDAAFPVSQQKLDNAARLEACFQVRNQTTRPAGPYPDLVTRFEKAVDAYPHKVAITYHDQSMTYAELDQRANRLANALLQRGLQFEERVGLDTLREPETIVRMLAILKAGGVYVPLDPEQPEARLQHMIVQSNTRLLLGRLPGAEAIEPVDHSDRPGLKINPSQLAYVLFTSGSTGLPKGVAISHGSVVNFLDAMAFEPGISADDCMPAITPFTFDISGLELFLPLGAGARINLLDSESATNARALAKALDLATVAQATPATWKALTSSGWKPSSSCRILCGGEAMPISLARTLTESGNRLFNMYGPTETTIWSSLARVGSARPQLGLPIANTRLYIADMHGLLAPDGAVGELWIGGVGLARGYFGDPVKTALAFIPDAFSGQSGQRLYRTGDLCRYGTDGALHYLARRDHQLKVRGYRIEADEVSARLEEIPEIGSAAVLGRDERLIAFVTPARGHHLEPELFDDWRRQLRQSLPDYMIPDGFGILDEMPCNANGKWDWRALGELPLSEVTSSREAKSETEKKMLALWCEILNRDAIGMDDNFFQVGGHSLGAIALVGQISDAFGVQISLKQFFENPTPCKLNQLVGESESLSPIPIAEEPFQLSRAQRRLWVLERLGRDEGAYNMGGGLRIRGPLHIATMERALTILIERHDILRARISEVAEEPVLQIKPAETVNLAVIETEVLARDELARGFIFKPYDLGQESLFRTGLLRQSADDHTLLIGAHHLVADDWSLGVFANELAYLYGSLRKGEEPVLKPLSRRYVDLSAWQWQADHDDELTWWRERLADHREAELPIDRPRHTQVRKGARRPLALSAEASAWVRANEHTAYATLLSVFQWMLSLQSGSSRIHVGTSVAGRERMESQGLVGLFVNTLVMRADLKPNKTFTTFLDDNAEAIRQSLARADAPFELVQDQLRDQQGGPLFRAFFVLHSALDKQIGGDWRQSGLDVAWREWDSPSTRFDLSLSLHESEAGFTGSFQYDANIFDAATIDHMARVYEALVLRLSQNDPLCLDRYPLPPDIPSFVERPTPADSLVERFAAFAAQNPQAPVLSGDGQFYTAARVNLWSDDLAARLSETGTDRVVAVLARREPQTVIALLAILKRGAVFLPIDPDLPEQRIRMMLEDANADHLIAPEDPGYGTPWISSEEPQQPLSFRMSKTSLSQTAYLIYTSGSTGRPKPVAVTHANLNGYLDALASHIQPESGMQYALVSSLSADLGNTVLFASLAYGGLLHVLPRDIILDTSAMTAYFTEHAIDVLKITPSHYRALLQTPDPTCLVPRRWLILGGEALDGAVVQKVKGLRPECRVLNHYGPSETTVGATRGETEGKGLITIGKPFPGSQAWVVNPHLEALSAGMQGELVIGGRQVSAGYRGRPGLTAARFVPDPFGAFGGRLYRTGDLTRRRVDGNLVFLGRIDDQVKIRGFRVEPGEIEACLREQSDVRDVGVLPIDGALWAFIAGSSALDIRELEHRIGARLPSYFIPSHWRLMESLPRNANGKLDRKSLLAMASQQEEAQETTSELSEREALMASLWEALLKPDRPLTRDDNFFAVGGDSILAIRLVTQARAHGFKLKPSDVFDHPSLAALAGASGSGAVATQERFSSGPVPMTPVQSEFFERVRHQRHHYNQSLLLKLEQSFDPYVLERSLSMLCERHEVLRYRYPLEGETHDQVAESQVTPVLEVIEFDGDGQAAVAKHAAAIQGGLDLVNGPLWRSVYFRTQDGDYLMLVFHHLIIDTMSWWILAEDLFAAYKALSAEQQPHFSLESTGYRQWSLALKEHAQGSDVQGEASYWRELGMEVAQSPASLPPNHEALWRTEASPAIEEALGDQADPQSLLLSALGTALTKAYGSLLLDLESHGRHEFRQDLDLTRSVGWFTAVYPIRLDTDAVGAVAIRQMLEAVPGNGLGYGLLRQQADIQDLPKAWARFNYGGNQSAMMPEGLSIAPFDRGPSRAASSGYVLDIQALYGSDGLTWEWRYDPDAITKEQVVDLAAATQDALKELLEEPLSEMPSADLLDMDTLNDVLSAFD